MAPRRNIPAEASSKKFSFIDFNAHFVLQEEPTPGEHGVESHLDPQAKPDLKIFQSKQACLEWALQRDTQCFPASSLAALTESLLVFQPKCSPNEDVSALVDTLHQIAARLIEIGRLEDGLTIWMRWLVVPEPKFDIVKTLPASPTYFDTLLLALLHSKHSNHQKFCLAILRGSIERLEREGISNELVSSERGQLTGQIEAYREFCSLYEIIVMGRYINQIEDCLVLLPKFACDSVVKSPWWLLLFKAALESNNEQIRRIFGTWLLKNFSGEVYKSGSCREVQVAFFNTFLTWATYGQILNRSIRRNGRLVVAEHGDLLEGFWLRITKQMPHFAEHAMEWLVRNVEKLNHHATVYLVRGIARAQAVTEKMALGAAKLTDTGNYNPVQSLLTQRHCLAIVEQYLRSSRDHGLLAGAAQELRSQIAAFNHYFEGEAGPLLLPTIRATALQDHAEGIRVQMAARRYLVDGGDHIKIDWDRITRYDPRQSFWKLFAQVWPVWADGMQQAGVSHEQVSEFVADCIVNFLRISRRKTYLWNITARNLHLLYFGAHSKIFQDPVIKQSLLDFINEPPQPSPEALLDVAVAMSDLDDTGKPLWFITGNESLGHAYIFDILNRLHDGDSEIGLHMLDTLLGPWREQIEPVPMVSKWKRTSQLQAMVVLLNSCVRSSEDIERYFLIFTDLLGKEPNPRNRFLLEWAVLYLCTSSRQSSRSFTIDQEKMADILSSLEQADPSNPSPKQVASQIKIALQLAMHESCAYVPSIERLLIILTTFINSPRVPIRFEAQASFPVLFEHVRDAEMLDKMQTAAVFKSVNRFITSLEKYKAPPEARVLGAFDLSKDMNLTTLFEGGYLFIPQGEPPLLYRDDLVEVAADAGSHCSSSSPSRNGPLPIGELNNDVKLMLDRLTVSVVSESKQSSSTNSSAPATAPTPLQTKSFTFDLAPLTSSLPSADATPQSEQKPAAGPILIGTLIDAAVNLGGLSRAANVFGCSSLHIPSSSVLTNQQFKSVSVDSELHLAEVRETTPTDLLSRLRELKAQGWKIVGLEQTSGSVEIGNPADNESAGQSIRKLPRKAAIVMGAEKTGIPADVLMECDVCVEIRQWGVTRSLNVQTAAACVLFEWRREWGAGTEHVTEHM